MMHNLEIQKLAQDTVVGRYDIYKLVKKIGLNNNVAEIGVAKGKNFAKIVWYALPKYAVGIDLWEWTEDNLWWTQEFFDSYRRKIIEAKPALEEKTGAKIDYIKGDCHKIVHQFEDEFFDFIYIDCDHRYEYVKRDLNDWWPKLRSGGIMAGHDYLEKSCWKGAWTYGVVTAVNEFVKEHELSWMHLTTKDSDPSYMFLKPE